MVQRFVGVLIEGVQEGGRYKRGGRRIRLLLSSYPVGGRKWVQVSGRKVQNCPGA